jgi:hypothetical protein
MLALALLVPRVAAYDVHHPTATDDLAALTNSFDTGTDFHDGTRWLVSWYGAKYLSINAVHRIIQGPLRKKFPVGSILALNKRRTRLPPL